ncbi:cryptic C4-dicarboxylate transporter DcuD [gut metagenome]|uniref:Cryptic C4-dicarboxylate transporter DcuD n=1 Tax=gut metagenome TaxID=749906 RepID=J9G4M3_9ZZZZ
MLIISATRSFLYDKVATRSLDDKAPTWFAILPFLPMIFVVLFSSYGIPGLKLHIIGVIFLSVIVGMLAETIHQRFNFNKVAEGAKVFFQAMGRSFGGVVILVIAAGIFADGFKALGMLSAIVNSAQSLGMGGLGMSIVFVLITVVVSIITGSNGASFYPIVSMIPTIAKSLNVPAVTLVLPMHQASTMARPLSPVAAVVVAIAGMLKVSPFAIVKRVCVPCVVALIVNHIFVYVLA